MKFYNNLTRQIEEFHPLKPSEVTIYSCGPTVYDVSHIGHARSSVSWDILYRYLNYKGYQVKWSRNITNVDDKIINRAKELGVKPDQLSRKYTYEFWADMTALNVAWPTYEPRATDYIQEMIKFIEGLIDKDFAYEVNGDVYFRVHKHEQYGQLKGLPLEELRKGVARVDENTDKEDKLDFALWKSFPGEHDDHVFDSPWSKGRPGWHLECSTMIRSLLGETIDIHAGGDDLIFPHHENECAQSECLTGEPLAKYWMHNGMIMIEGKKMSKSENNFLTIKDILGDFKSNSIRYFILTTHYKKQLNYTHEAVKAAETGFENLYKALSESLGDKLSEDVFGSKDVVVGAGMGGAASSENLFEVHGLDRDLVAKFEEAMDDDLNTCKALALLFEARSEKSKALTIKYLLEILGFDLIHHASSNSSDAAYEIAMQAAMELVIEERTKARASKDFATSDKIRDKLAAANVVIKDYKDKPSEWQVGE